MSDNKRILLIDDDAELRQLYTLIFSKAGFSLIAVSDGVEGLSKAREGGYACILLDLMMPNMDGMAFLKGLRDEPAKKPNGPILVLSNAGYEKVEEEARKLGAKDFLLKAELSPDDLVNAVKKNIR